jgi:hypothetical protein
LGELAGVYKITNKQNSKIYIGESEDISHRWIEHITDLICGEHCNSKLQTDFKDDNILQDTVKVLKQLRKEHPDFIYYDKFIQYF